MQGKEDEHAYHGTDFGYYRSFCKRQKSTEGFAMGILDLDDMVEMLAVTVVDDKNIARNLRTSLFVS
jgi:hypothetical protein